MRCSEFLRHLGPLLDSECDAETHLALAQHLEVCASCAQRLQQEQRLEASLKRALSNDAPADTALWQRLTARSLPARATRRRAALIAAVLLVLAGLSAAFWLQQERSFALASVAHADHVKWSREEQRSSLLPCSWEEVGQTLHGRLPFEVALARSMPQGFELAGVRACTIGRTPVALIIGDAANRPVSLFLFPDSELAHFPDAREALQGDGSAFHFRNDSVAGCALRRGHSVICVTGEGDAGALAALARAVAEQLELSQ